MTTTKLLVDTQLKSRGANPAPIPRPEGVEWRIVLVVGAALSLIAWTDIGLLWYPLNFGNVDWEFGTITALFDALPLATMGMAGMIAAAYTLRTRWLSVGLAAASFLIVALLSGLVAVYVLAVLSGLKGLNPAYEVMFVRAVLKTSVLAVTYVTLYAWLGWTSARANRLG